MNYTAWEVDKNADPGKLLDAAYEHLKDVKGVGPGDPVVPEDILLLMRGIIEASLESNDIPDHTLGVVAVKGLLDMVIASPYEYCLSNMTVAGSA